MNTVRKSETGRRFAGCQQRSLDSYLSPLLVDLQDIRRIAASARGASFVLPRIGVETLGAANREWDMPVVPSQRDVVRGIEFASGSSVEVVAAAAVAVVTSAAAKGCLFECFWKVSSVRGTEIHRRKIEKITP